MRTGQSVARTIAGAADHCVEHHEERHADAEHQHAREPEDGRAVGGRIVVHRQRDRQREQRRGGRRDVEDGLLPQPQPARHGVDVQIPSSSVAWKNTMQVFQTAGVRQERQDHLRDHRLHEDGGVELRNGVQTKSGTILGPDLLVGKRDARMNPREVPLLIDGCDPGGLHQC